MAHSPLLVSVYENNMEDFGSLMRNCIRKVHWGMILGHFFLFFVCTLTMNLMLAGVNLVLLVAACLNIYYLNHLARIEKIVKENQWVGEKEFSSAQLKTWENMFIHPVERHIAQFKSGDEKKTV